MIPLINVGIREIEDDRTKPFCFELFPLAGEKVKSSKPTPNEAGKMTEGKQHRLILKNKKQTKHKIIKFLGHHSVYRMSATSEEERKEWIRALRFASQNEFPKQRLSNSTPQ